MCVSKQIYRFKACFDWDYSHESYQHFMPAWLICPRFVFGCLGNMILACNDGGCSGTTGIASLKHALLGDVWQLFTK
ncbi:MAG: hypothetical protein ACSLEL_01690 [Candidatus Malihini olakiniferum]